eukprot:g2700.t1
MFSFLTYELVVDVCGHCFIGYVALVVAASLLTALYRCTVCRKRFSLHDKHVLITGGSSGIGLAIAKEVVRRGARVTILARNKGKLDSACAKLNDEESKEGSPLTAQSAAADVTKFESVAKAVSVAESSFGTVDVLVTSAGSATPGYFLDQDPSVFENSMRLNYLGTVNAAKAIAPSMTNRGEGHLVFVASAAAVVSFLGYSSYAPTKYALRGFADSLRNELRGFGIRVSIAYPPDTDTPGFENENKTKPKETLEITPPSVYKPSIVASQIVNGIEMGDYHLSSPDVVQNLLVTAMSGVSPRAYPMLELAILPLLGLIQLIFMFYADYIARGYGARMLSFGRGSNANALDSKGGESMLVSETKKAQ